MKNGKKRITRIAERLVAEREIIAVPLVEDYKGCKIRLNPNDHRPPHLAVWYGNPRQNADFIISSGPTDGQMLENGGFPHGKLKIINEWFAPANRPHRVDKIMDCLLKHGEPTWFSLPEIFTPAELAEYNRRKAAGGQ